VNRYRGGGGPRALPKKRCGVPPEPDELGRTKSLILAAIRVWELKKGRVSYGMAERIRANI
jgi:hypothetical protein